MSTIAPFLYLGVSDSPNTGQGADPLSGFQNPSAGEQGIPVTPGAGGPTTAPPPPKKPSTMTPLLLLVVIFAIFYFVGIRPQQKQAKKHRELVKSLGVGDEVITSAGILGRITKIDGEIMTVEVDKNTRIRILKSHANTKQVESE